MVVDIELLLDCLNDAIAGPGSGRIAANGSAADGRGRRGQKGAERDTRRLPGKRAERERTAAGLEAAWTDRGPEDRFWRRRSWLLGSCSEGLPGAPRVTLLGS